MSIKDRAEATGKNLEGKAQEAMGDVKGSPSDKAKGQAKQAEAQAKHSREDIKDQAKKMID